MVRTDPNGHYRIPIGEDAILFAVKPSGWVTPQTRDRLPLFHYVHKPKGSPPGLAFPGVEPTGPLPESVDFPLTRRVERSRFRVILFGDTQTYTLEEVGIFAHDIVEELIGADVAFGLSLGDVVGDDLSLFDPVNGAVGRIGVPWYNVHGNHDMNLRAESDAHADETWERVYGPTTYAFEYGPVHFIVLDDVIYRGVNPEDGSPGSYAGGLTPDQLAFVRDYLAGVPRDHLVVLAMHIPLALPDTMAAPDDYQVPQRRELFEILSGHPHTLSLSAHMHVQFHQFFGPEHGYRAPRPHHHLVHATASGSWWLGEPDEFGIPHATMRCGAPNGYSIISFDGNRYSIRFKAARRPASHQMHVVAPDAVPSQAAGQTEVLVNVYAGSERSIVEMRLGNTGQWKELERVPREDPHYAAAWKRAVRNPSPSGLELLPPIPSPHTWVGMLPADPPRGTAALEVRTTDLFGQVYTAHRVIRID